MDDGLISQGHVSWGSHASILIKACGSWGCMSGLFYAYNFDFMVK